MTAPDAPDGYDDFRRRHDSPRAALDACARPEWAVRLALSVAPTDAVKREVLRLGAVGARFLHASNARALVELVTPFPDALDVVVGWAVGEEGLSRRLMSLPALVVASIFMLPLVVVVDRLLLQPRLGDGTLHFAALHVVLAAGALVAAPLIALVSRRLLRRRIAAMTVDDATRIVERALAHGARLHPDRAPVALDAFRRKLAPLFP